jgi:integrase
MKSNKGSASQVTGAVTLTERVIAKVTPRDRAYEVRDAAMPGLRLLIQPSGVKSFIVRYWFDRQHAKATLGRWPVLLVKSARAAAREVLAQVAEGRDPRRREDEETFTAAVALYIERHASKLRPTTRQYVERELKLAGEHWRGRPLNEITRRDVIAITDKVEQTRGRSARGTLLKVLSAFFRWCMSRDLIGASPAVGVRREKYVPKDRTLSDDELAIVWRAALKRGGVYSVFTRLLILTAMRRNEVAHLEWREIGDVIEIEPAKTKTNVRLRIPITGMVRAMLDGIERRGPFVLLGAKPLHVSNTCEDVLDVKLATHWTWHDLRRSVASGMARIGVSGEIIERCLGHRIRGIAGVYQRHTYEPEIASAFEKWAAHVARTLTLQK